MELFSLFFIGYLYHDFEQYSHFHHNKFKEKSIECHVKMAFTAEAWTVESIVPIVSLDLFGTVYNLFLMSWFCWNVLFSWIDLVVSHLKCWLSVYMGMCFQSHSTGCKETYQDYTLGMHLSLLLEARILLHWFLHQNGKGRTWGRA